MKKLLLPLLIFIGVFTSAKAQTTASDFTKKDCNGNVHNLFADLDAGKAVVLFFYMPNCGSCPPPAKKIQQMANNIMRTYPGKVKGYAFPYENKTTCSYSATWVSSNGLSLYTPLDSGVTQVAYYGGFGMPTVVLLGGRDRKVLFNSQSFSTSDTTIMRNEILKLFGGATGIEESSKYNNLNIFPNPAQGNVNISLNLKESSSVFVNVTDITGKQVAVIINEKIAGNVIRQFNTLGLPNGIYMMNLNIDGRTTTRKISINN
ncbi:MAG: T9SS type A sorting domain-containing protein [Bacteroidia bacterium]